MRGNTKFSNETVNNVLSKMVDLENGSIKSVTLDHRNLKNQSFLSIDFETEKKSETSILTDAQFSDLKNELLYNVVNNESTFDETVNYLEKVVFPAGSKVDKTVSNFTIQNGVVSKVDTDLEVKLAPAFNKSMNDQQFSNFMNRLSVSLKNVAAKEDIYFSSVGIQYHTSNVAKISLKHVLDYNEEGELVCNRPDSILDQDKLIHVSRTIGLQARNYVALHKKFNTSDVNRMDSKIMFNLRYNEKNDELQYATDALVIDVEHKEHVSRTNGQIEVDVADYVRQFETLNKVNLNLHQATQTYSAKKDSFKGYYTFEIADTYIEDKVMNEKYYSELDLHIEDTYRYVFELSKQTPIAFRDRHVVRFSSDYAQDGNRALSSDNAHSTFLVTNLPMGVQFDREFTQFVGFMERHGAITEIIASKRGTVAFEGTFKSDMVSGISRSALLQDENLVDIINRLRRLIFVNEFEFMAKLSIDGAETSIDYLAYKNMIKAQTAARKLVG
jgi:hypothetical protein